MQVDGLEACLSPSKIVFGANLELIPPFPLPTTEKTISPAGLVQAVPHDTAPDTSSRHRGSFTLPDVPSRLSYCIQDADLTGFSHLTTTNNAGAEFLPIISSPNSTSSSTRQAAPIYVSETISPGDQHDGVSPDLALSPDLIRSKIGLRLYEERMLLPFTVPQEALLFHHYMERLAALVRDQFHAHVLLCLLMSRVFKA